MFTALLIKAPHWEQPKWKVSGASSPHRRQCSNRNEQHLTGGQGHAASTRDVSSRQTSQVGGHPWGVLARRKLEGSRELVLLFLNLVPAPL